MFETTFMIEWGAFHFIIIAILESYLRSKSIKGGVENDPRGEPKNNQKVFE